MTTDTTVPRHLLPLLRKMAVYELELSAGAIKVGDDDIAPEDLADLRRALGAHDAVFAAHPEIGDDVRYLAARTVQWETGDDPVNWPGSRADADAMAERLRHLTELMEIGGVA